MMVRARGRACVDSAAGSPHRTFLYRSLFSMSMSEMLAFGRNMAATVHHIRLVPSLRIGDRIKQFSALSVEENSSLPSPYTDLQCTW